MCKNPLSDAYACGSTDTDTLEGWICLDQLANEMHNTMGLLLHLRKSSIGRNVARTNPPKPAGSAAGQESVDALTPTVSCMEPSTRTKQMHVSCSCV